MRLVSLNAWGGAMFDDLASWLPSCEADVVCLQEVTSTPGLGGWTEFADEERTLPQRADLFADLTVLLPRHQGHFLTSDTGPVMDDDGRTWQQDFGIATFVHERMPLVGVASGFVHGAFTEHSTWAIQDRPRTAGAVRVVERDSGRAFTVVNLHGLRNPAGKGDTPTRRSQAHRLAELVATIRERQDHVIVCGDLNLLPASETFEILRSRLGLTDLVGDADTRSSQYRKPIRHASYMLVSDPSAVRNFEIVAAPEVSDHRALLLDL